MTETKEYGMLLPVETAVAERFGSKDIARGAETASTAVAEQAKAAVQARYVIAWQRPRDWDDVRVRLLKECRRPSFAATARYRKPVGKGVEGPSIRFAEAAMRCMGNILPEVMTTYDDAEKRVCRASVTDLESNVTYSKDVIVEKAVERSKVPDGVIPLRVRTNSLGKTTYVLPATDDDLLNKEAALVSKALRNQALRLLPGDILDECMVAVVATLRDADAKDPDAARKAVSDAFAGIGVQPSALKQYLGHDLGMASPIDLGELRAVFAAIRDGEATWTEVLAQKTGTEEAPTAQSRATEEAKQKIRERTSRIPSAETKSEREP